MFDRVLTTLLKVQKVPPEVFCKKKMLSRISQYSQENTCVGVSCNFIKKRLKHRCFPIKNTYFEKHLRTAASGGSRTNLNRYWIGLFSIFQQKYETAKLRLFSTGHNSFSRHNLLFETITPDLR